MAIGDDFSINSSGDIRHVSGSTKYTILDLHAWLQDLADDAAASGNDILDILAPNPSKLNGPRDPTNAAQLNLLTHGSTIFNIDETAAQYFYFGSIKQNGGNVQYSGLLSNGVVVADSPMYVVQNGNKLTKFWPDGHIQIIVKVKEGGSLIDSGDVTVFSRKWGQTFSHSDVNLSAGSERSAPVQTALDKAIVLTEIEAAALSSKVTITFGEITRDLGDGSGPQTYKGSIALSDGCSVQEAYQYTQYITREDSTEVLNGVPGWRYRVLDPVYVENTTAPFGTFAGGTWFVAQGWWLEGVLGAESTAYELISDEGTTLRPPVTATISVGNLVPGDRVLVTRSSGGAVLMDEYTPVPQAAGETSLVVSGSIKADTPSAGAIRVAGIRYDYTAWAGSTFSGISPALPQVFSADDVFVPFIDRVADDTVEEVSFISAGSFTARVDVRRGTGGNPIVPFDTILSVTATGGSVNAVRASDVE
jgi:hypothetical protein